MPTLLIQLGRLDDVMQTTPLLQELAAAHLLSEAGALVSGFVATTQDAVESR